MPETPQSLNAEHVTLNAERNYPLVALPHLRFTISAINNKWEGDIQADVALPLVDQPANNSISEVGVRLKGGLKSLKFEKFKRFRVLQSFDFSLCSFVP